MRMDKEILRSQIVTTNSDNIKNKIYTIRGLKVMLDSDLAKLYGIEAFRLNERVKRNIKRFPENFMFRLTEEEFDSLTSQIAMINKTRGKHKKYLPLVFTEQGISMLSGVLNSDMAIEISIEIINAFVSMRKFISENSEMFIRLDNVEKKQFEYNKKFEKVFKAIEDNILTKKQGVYHKGQVYDAHKFVYNLINSAKKSIILVDNYIDSSVFDLFSKRNKNVKVTIYTKKIDNELKLALDKFNSQNQPVEIKQFKDAHDRFLMIDDESYIFGHSLKDLGKAWCGFFKCDKETLRINDMLK